MIKNIVFNFKIDETLETPFDHILIIKASYCYNAYNAYIKIKKTRRKN
jgi:hypothetical protein